VVVCAGLITCAMSRSNRLERQVRERGELGWSGPGELSATRLEVTPEEHVLQARVHQLRAPWLQRTVEAEEPRHLSLEIHAFLAGGRRPAGIHRTAHLIRLGWSTSARHWRHFLVAGGLCLVKLALLLRRLPQRESRGVQPPGSELQLIVTPSATPWPTGSTTLRRCLDHRHRCSRLTEQS
jgi:hypothetical protein